MTRLRRRFSPLAVLTGLALSIGVLSGCTPTPEPTPTPTSAFASEEEAFAAAEETYRAYNDALNQVDPSSPDTFEKLFELSSGSFEQADRENFSIMHADGHTIEGQAEVLSFTGHETAPPFDTVTAIVCLDVSEVIVRDVNGDSLVNPNRPDRYALDVGFRTHDGSMLIDSAERIEDERCDAA